MSTRTTDNFLPYSRGETYYFSRPIHVRRHNYGSYRRQLQISDSPPETKIPKSGQIQKLLIYALAVAVIGLGSVGLTSIKANRQSIAQVQALQTVEVESSNVLPASFGLPTRLKIPEINVDAVIEQVGLTSQGDMEVPEGRANAGWFNQGPRPGEIGSSVIDGHFGLKNDMSGAFDNLSKLRGGDKIYIQDDKGVIIAFVVRASRSYDPEADASEVFSSNDGKAHLNLITCEGVWDKTRKSYSERLVVFADREP